MIDDYVQYGQSTQKTFYQVEHTKEQIELESSTGQIASIYFRFDYEYSIYERRIYSLGELLGQIGGLFQIILMVGVTIVSLFSEKLFVSSIIRKIYQIDDTREDVVRNISKLKMKKSKTVSFDNINRENFNVDDENLRSQNNESASNMNNDVTSQNAEIIKSEIIKEIDQVEKIKEETNYLQK